MINNRKIIIDNHCLRHWKMDGIDEIFDDLKDKPIDVTAIYIVGFNQFIKYDNYICELISNHVKIILFNPLEG